MKFEEAMLCRFDLQNSGNHKISTALSEEQFLNCYSLALLLRKSSFFLFILRELRPLPLSYLNDTAYI